MTQILLTGDARPALNAAERRSSVGGVTYQPSQSIEVDQAWRSARRRYR